MDGTTNVTENLSVKFFSSTVFQALAEPGEHMVSKEAPGEWRALENVAVLDIKSSLTQGRNRL
jgi:hypothetical protein